MRRENQFINAILILCGIGMFILCNTGCKKSSNGITETSYLPPVLSTSGVSNIGSTTATCGGNITNAGSGTITARGVCWSTHQNTSVADSKTSEGSGTGSFTSNLTGLLPSTPYYVRAYAINSNLTGYGTEVTFTTTASVPGQVTDYDGNVYTTVTIGTQVWLAENLRVTHYRNGDPINSVKGMKNMKFPSTAGQYWDYNNDTANGRIYGHLYNFFAIADVRSIAPNGCHIATDSEWTVLSNYLTADSVGGRLKEAGTMHWTYPNLGATNSTGFTALPGGYRDTDGTYTQMGYYDYIWTSTQYSSVDGLDRFLGFNFAWMGRNMDDKNRGMSVRCIQGN
jgi:uncharacterized protein (TIGR02145 family)